MHLFLGLSKCAPLTLNPNRCQFINAVISLDLMPETVVDTLQRDVGDAMIHDFPLQRVGPELSKAQRAFSGLIPAHLAFVSQLQRSANLLGFLQVCIVNGA